MVIIGTQCDSVFPECACHYPYELLVDAKHSHAAYVGSYHCNLFGMALNESWAMARELAQDIRSKTDEYLGPSAWAVRELWASEATLAAIPTEAPMTWQPQPEARQAGEVLDDDDDIDGGDHDIDGGDEKA